MILLPRGNPVKEGIDPGKVQLPEALLKLQRSGFSGYLRFDTTQGTGILIFAEGRLISALFDGAHEKLIAYDALQMIFERALAGNATLDIFRLSSELAMSIHALLHGDLLSQGQEVRLVDVRGLLARLKADRVSGCLRIYTKDHVALIFYREGVALGFFHDGSNQIEKSAENSLSVARLPGAKIDVLSMALADEKNLADLLASGDLGALWQTARERVIKERRFREAEVGRSLEQRQEDLRRRVLDMLMATAEKNLGRIGPSLAEKEFEKAMARGSVVSEAVLSDYFERISRAARLVAGSAAVRQMVEEMQRGVKTLVKTL